MDDDNYVNPRALLQLLKTFPRDRDVYVGKPSLNRPIHASELQSKNRTVCPFLLFRLAVAFRGGLIPGGETCPGGGTWLLSKAWVIQEPRPGLARRPLSGLPAFLTPLMTQPPGTRYH